MTTLFARAILALLATAALPAFAANDIRWQHSDTEAFAQARAAPVRHSVP